jgi:hypothetical protein
MTTRPFPDPEIRFVETEHYDDAGVSYDDHHYVLDISNPGDDVIIIDLLYHGNRCGHMAIYGGVGEFPGDIEVELERA